VKLLKHIQRFDFNNFCILVHFASAEQVSISVAFPLQAAPVPTGLGLLQNLLLDLVPPIIAQDTEQLDHGIQEDQPPSTLKIL